MDLNLATDGWIPTSRRTLASLNDCWECGLAIELGRIPAVTKAALLRLILWIDHQGGRKWLDQNVDTLNVFGPPEQRFLQDADAATGSSSRPSWQILSQEDGGSAALSPNRQGAMPFSAEVGLALLTAAMADRGGIKASLAVGGAKSAIAAPLAGNYIVFRYGRTLAEIISANREFVTEEVAKALMWRWRRIFVQDNGRIVVAAANNDRPDTIDPFIGGKAKRLATAIKKDDFDPGSPVWEASCGKKCSIMALATNQALPLAHYERVVTATLVPKANEAEPEP